MRRSLFTRSELRAIACVCSFYCTLAAFGQQISSQVNAQAGAGSSPSGVQANVQSMIRASPTHQGSIGANSGSGLGFTRPSNGLSDFADNKQWVSTSAKLPGAFGGSAIGHRRISPGYVSTGESGTVQTSTSKDAFRVSHVESLTGGGLVPGQFPDSTREVVLPSPLLSGNSLEFFSTAEPRFSTSFDIERHLSPSYAVGQINTAQQTKSKRHSGLNRSWPNDFHGGYGITLGAQTYTTVTRDALKSGSLADRLKNQSHSLLNSNSPN